MLTLAIAALLLPLVSAVPVSNTILNLNLTIANPAATNVVKDSYIVVYKSGVADAVASAHEALIHTVATTVDGLTGVGNTFKLGGLRGYQVHVDSAGLAKISQSPLVAYVEKDAKVSISDTSSVVTRSPSTWGLARISQRNAVGNNPTYVSDSTGCAGARAYIVDTGLVLDHSEFKANGVSRALFGANYVSGSPNTDENGHGTHVGGTIGGSTYGVCSKITLIAIKALDKNGGGSWSNVLSAIQWAVNDATARGVISKSVLNLSIASDSSSAINSAMKAAVDKGMTIVAAAGNSGVDAANSSPASEPSVITVGAIDSTDSKPSWSNYGSVVDVFAPGDSILSAGFSCSTCTATMSGTSMAAPHVAGLAAYLMIKEGISSPADVAARISALATSGLVKSAGSGSPNLIANNGNGRS